MGIAQSILDIAVEAARSHQAARVTGVKVRIGQITGVDPEALAFGFTALSAGTIAQGASLTIETVPASGCCRECRHEFSFTVQRFFCPECGSAGIEILSGRELQVEHVEVD